MSWDLNRQAKAFLICLGTPWLFVLLAAFLLVVLALLWWLGVLYRPIDG